MEQGVSHALGGGDDGLGALDGLVDGVEHGGDGALFGQGREEERETTDTVTGHLEECTACSPSLEFIA